MNLNEANGQSAPKPVPQRRRTLRSRLPTIFTLVSTGVLLCCCIPSIVLIVAIGLDEVTDSAKVEESAQKIAPLVVPPDFLPTKARRADSSLMFIQVAKFTHKQGRGKFVVGRVHMPFEPEVRTPPEPDKTRKPNEVSLLNSMVDQMFPGRRLIEVRNTRRKQVLIGDMPITFTIVEGSDLSSITEMIQVTGSYTGPTGSVQLLLQSEAGYVTNEAIDALVESFAAPPAASP